MQNKKQSLLKPFTYYDEIMKSDVDQMAVILARFQTAGIIQALDSLGIREKISNEDLEKNRQHLVEEIKKILREEYHETDLSA